MLFARSQPGYEPASLPGGGNSDSFSCAVAGHVWSRRGFQGQAQRVARLLLRIGKSLLNTSLATEILPLETLGGGPAQTQNGNNGVNRMF